MYFLQDILKNFRELYFLDLKYFFKYILELHFIKHTLKLYFLKYFLELYQVGYV